jgi:very-short-patch-repair endonuclease
LRHTPTPAEARLWAYLRANQLHGVSFRRQHAIGRYVVDFCSPRHRLIIELDGSPHLHAVGADLQRTRALEVQGYRVLGFWNSQIMDQLDGVVQQILEALALK